MLVMKLGMLVMREMLVMKLGMLVMREMLGMRPKMLAMGPAIEIRAGATRVTIIPVRESPGIADISQVLEPLVGPPGEMLHALPFAIGDRVTFIGDGALRYRDQIEHARPLTCIIEPMPLLAPALARLGRRRAAAGSAGPPHALQPLYVRRPDAELDRERQANV